MPERRGRRVEGLGEVLRTLALWRMLMMEVNSVFNVGFEKRLQSERVVWF